jgi:hypothetical protein
MLAFLDASKDNIGNMDFAGMPAGYYNSGSHVITRYGRGP